ncbi:MAG: crossover junction endodeoxyribonuclease RuvC [Desulfovibrionaceae bacterium]|nr:crossover junction endodeoxyribonuclease RuvC [Desulfovibrionaceae bacterium]
MATVTVIGIDPGSQHTGFGIVRASRGVMELVDCGVIHTGTNKEFSERLCTIYRELSQVLTRYTPQEAAIEQVFVSQNAQSALKLGQARGVAVAACAQHNLTISDYSATQVKKALVGAGHAEKTQVAFMVKTMLKINEAKWALDTSDALGLALCHLTMRQFQYSLQRSM